MPGELEFDHPPIIELVLGAQFSPIVGLSSAHYGKFWGKLGDEWGNPQDVPPLKDQFESFEQPLWSRQRIPTFFLEPANLATRLTLAHRDENLLLQVQASRFHLNWRRVRSKRFYPSYSRLIDDFLSLFARFESFVAELGLGPVKVNQWELTYVDDFPEGEYWSSPSEWDKVLPGLFGTPVAGDDLSLEHRSAEWAFQIKPLMGRLHVSAKSARLSEADRASLLLEMTARGPVGPNKAPTLRAGLDIGHRAALDTFLRVTSPEAQARWGPRK